MEIGYNNISDTREERVKTIGERADEYMEEYELKHPRSAVFANYAIGHLKKHLGRAMIVDVNEKKVSDYQVERLREGPSPKTINEEVGFLLRLLGRQGDALRGRLREEKSLRLPSMQVCFNVRFANWPGAKSFSRRSS